MHWTKLELVFKETPLQVFIIKSENKQKQSAKPLPDMHKNGTKDTWTGKMHNAAW